jgi:V8-like Glu-specific endopeptidase
MIQEIRIMPAIQELVRQLPPLVDVVEKYEALAGLAPSAQFETHATVAKALVGAVEDEKMRVVAAGTSALNKIAKEGIDATLAPEETRGLEAIVLLEGRPAILIQDGKFFPPPAKWQILEAVRDKIQDVFRSVGRIELTGHPRYDWVGTGFLVADDVIMTNRHVAQEFCRQGSKGWKFEAGITGRIDWIEELGASVSAEYAIESIIGVHPKYDLALFRIARAGGNGAGALKPLAVAAKAPAALIGRQIYTVGYPAEDGRRNDPDQMRRIFSGIYNVKRLQPGELRAFDKPARILVHDCSTLGGNSGSCVVDLQTHQVVGLHFGGRYLQGNQAVALWTLTNDALLKKGGVNFV